MIIGDREVDNKYIEHVYSEKTFHLLPSENNDILGHIATVSPIYNNIIQEIKDNDKLLDHASLSMILFVVAHTLKEKEADIKLDLKNGIKTKFQKIIAKKVWELEHDKKSIGLGKALFLMAKIYSSKNLSYVVFPEDFLLETAAFLGNNENLIKRIKSNRTYPEQINTLVYKRPFYLKKAITSTAFILIMIYWQKRD